MQTENLIIRQATSQELDRINRIVEQAVMTWELPDRVVRLVLPSYRYSQLDLQHMQLLVATEPSGGIIGVVAWEQADPKQTPDGLPAHLLHGLFIAQDRQRQGIGRLLLKRAEQLTADNQVSGMLIKAQAAAVDFFLANGYRKLPATDTARDYQNRYWKRLAP